MFDYFEQTKSDPTDGALSKGASEQKQQALLTDLKCSYPLIRNYEVYYSRAFAMFCYKYVMN
jgi:hypothetical protein